MNTRVVNVTQAKTILSQAQSSSTVVWSYLSNVNQAEVEFTSANEEEVAEYKSFVLELEQLQQTEESRLAIEGALKGNNTQSKDAKVVSVIFNWFGMSSDGSLFRFKTASLDSQVVKQVALWKKIGNFLEDTAETQAEEIAENSEQVSNIKKAPRNNVLSVIVFYGLSCIGKTHYSEIFKKICEERGIAFSTVSSDESSRQAMDAFLKKKPDATEDDAFSSTKKQAVNIFNKGIKAVVNTLKDGPALLFLDKVMHGGRFLGGFKKSFPSETHEIRMVAVYPWSDFRFKIAPNTSVPFNASLILNVAHRMVSREAHDTVSGSATKKIFLALSFVLLYKNVRNIEKIKARDCDYHSFHTLNFGVGVPPYTEKNHDSE